jgi:hypothetical protein
VLYRLRHYSAGTPGASGAFGDECVARTGKVRDEAAARSMLLDTLATIADTNIIVNACERSGMPVRFAGTPREAEATGRRYCPPLAAVSLADGAALEFPNIRRCQCFPTVMQARRSGMKLHLEYYIRRAQAKGRVFRHINFTSGTRWRDGALIGNIGESTREFHKCLSAFFKTDEFRSVFATVLMGMEYGTPKPWVPQLHFIQDGLAAHDDAAPVGGGLTLHLHCHCIVEVTGEVVNANGDRSKAAWNDFMNRLRIAFGSILAGGRAVSLEECRALVEDCGFLRKTEEACKYPLKTEDLKSIETMGSSSDLAEFCRQMRHLRLVTPRGEFAQFRKWVKTRHKKVIRVDGGGLKVIADPNWLGFEPPPRVAKKRAESARKRGITETANRAVNARFLGFVAAWKALKNGREMPPETPPFDEELQAGYGYGQYEPPLIFRVVSELLRLYDNHPSAIDFFKCPVSLLEELMQWGTRSCPLDIPESAYREAEMARDGAEPPPPAEIKAVINRVFSISLPTWFGGSRVAVPYAFVAGYNGDFGALVGRERPRVVHEFVREALAESCVMSAGGGGARTLMEVHNIHITFPTHGPPGRASPPPEPGNPEFAALAGA